MASSLLLRSLIGLAWLNVCLHITALAMGAVGIVPGSPLVGLRERLDYLAGRPAGWMVAWCLWMCGAVSLIAFLAVLTSRLDGQTRLAPLGLMIALVGAAFDLCCDAIYLLVLPMLAAWQPRAEVLFLVTERVTGIASLVIANGSYSIGILLLTLAMRPRPEFGRWTIGIGYALAGFGLLLAAAGFTGEPWHAACATLATIGFFCLWVLLVAHAIKAAP